MTATTTKRLNTPGYTLPTADRPDVGVRRASSSSLTDSVNAGMEDSETGAIERNSEFYATVVARLHAPVNVVDVEDIFPDL